MENGGTGGGRDYGVMGRLRGDLGNLGAGGGTDYGVMGRPKRDWATWELGEGIASRTGELGRGGEISGTGRSEGGEI